MTSKQTVVKKSDAKEAASILDEDEYLAGEEDGEDVDGPTVGTPKAPQYIGGPAPLGRNGSARSKDHTK